MKLTYDDKLKIIELYKQGNGYLVISKKFNVAFSTIRKIVNTYKIYGLEVLKHGKSKKITPDLKLEIIAKWKSGKSLQSLTYEYLLSPPQIYKWIQQYEEFGYNGLMIDNRGRPKSMSKEKKPIPKSLVESEREELIRLREENKDNNTVKYYRDFVTTAPNQKWTTDVSEFHIAAGKLYFSPILDMHTREIISYNISTHPTFHQTLDMLKKAFKNHPNLDGLIFHSDQGWQYQMQYYRDELSKCGIKQSMSRKGNCYDNSPMENFFGVMKKEMFIGHEYEFETLEQLKEVMVEYIEYYNKTRISTKLKGMSPLMYRQHSLNNLILSQ